MANFFVDIGLKNGWSGTSRCHPILICTTPYAVQR
nr:MAG TPA: hypothetical protein [Caudoviricetes sp.]